MLKFIVEPYANAMVWSLIQNMLMILYDPCVEWKTCEGYIEINWLNLGGYECCNYWLNVSRCYMNAYWSVGVEIHECL